MKRNVHVPELNKLSDNGGFSLMELLVSIVILVLIMVPLMNNFIRSGRLNSEAGRIQECSNLAANMMEDMKAMNSGVILTQPNRLYQSGSSYTTVSTGDTDIYYFGKKGTSDDGTKYDVLITVDPEIYKYDATKHNNTLMNNYKMPDIAVLNGDINGMFFSNMYKNISTNSLEIKDDDPLTPAVQSLDQIALDTFKAEAQQQADEEFQKSEAYAGDGGYLEQLEDYRNGKITTPPTMPSRTSNPDYCEEANIYKWTNRITGITVLDKTDASGQHYSEINYKIAYRYNWPDRNIHFALTDTIVKPYTSVINNVYLYYQTSLFQENGRDPLNFSNHPDIINFASSSTNPVNLYIVKQSVDASNPYITINLSGSGSNAVQIYTNMADSNVKVNGFADAHANSEIITSKTKNRIYAVKVQIYKFTEGAAELKYQEKDKLYTLESNIEE